MSTRRENEKIRLDDYLCSHSVEEFKKLPIHKIRKPTIKEAIDAVTDTTPFDEIKYILKLISHVSFESEMSGHVNRLSEKTGISKRTFRKT